MNYKKWIDQIKSKNVRDLGYLYPFFFTLVFVVILLQYSFSGFDAIFYDSWIRFDIGIKNEKRVIIISLDEESDEFLGEIYPYTYASHARFINKLIEDKPAAIGYLVNLTDVENETQAKYQQNFKDTINNFTAHGGGFRLGTEMDAFGEQLPQENLRDLGFSLSLLNIDNKAFGRDDIARRCLLNISGEDSFHLWLANYHRRRNNQEKLDANTISGSYYSREADASFSLFRYFTSPVDREAKIITIPFHRVLKGNFPPGFFENKIVIVGPKYIASSSDFILTPFNKETYNASKLNVHATIVESLIQGKTILEIPDIVTDTLAVIMAIILSYLISQLRPSRGLLITLSLIVCIFLLSFCAFSFLGVWIKLSHLILTVFTVYYIWVPFRAIGEYQRRYAIQEETKILKQVDNLKQNFISLMSHDLKTPVAKIAGLADILHTQYPNTADQSKNIKSIIDATHDLNKFITSILDLTKIESQNLNLKKTSKDINKIIDAIVSKLKFEAGNNEINLTSELGPLYPISIDAELLNRVISNLIENAIKYSGKGSTVSVKTWDDEKWVWVEIKDNGIGIGENDLIHIFDKFYRVKNDKTHAIKGSGLGLYLVKYFIELHQGEITCTSKVGVGTTFTIKLKNA
ncbi:MAG: ATP-binding protein [Bacteriovoracaceae bacterium]